MAAESEEDLEDSEEFIEVPSCIESLTSSAGQLRQLARQATNYYGKLLLCYGCPSESSSSLFAQANNDSPATSPIEAPPCCKNASKRAHLNQRTGLSNKSDSSKTKHRDVRSNPVDLKRLASDRQKLESISSLVNILPYLNELCSFVERCSVTIEATIKRITYYLNRATQRDKRPSIVKHETFELTPDVRLDAVFVSLMDLMFGLISLEQTLRDRTTILDELNLIDAICRHLEANPSDLEELDPAEGYETSLLSGPNMARLNEYLSTIRLTLACDGGSHSDAIFRQCIDHVQHLNLSLSRDKTQPGFAYFAQLFESFLIFYSDHLIDISAQNNNDLTKSNSKVAKTVAIILIGTNVIPTLFMNTHPRKILGLCCLGILYSSIFGKTDKRVNRAINQAIQRTNCHNLVLLEICPCHLLLDEFLSEHMAPSCVEKKSLDHLAGKLNLLLKLDMNLEFERLLLKSSSWLSKLKCEAVGLAHNQAQEWPRRQILLLDQGLRLFEELSTIVGYVSASHQHQGVSVSKSTLLGLYRIVALLKSLQTSLETNLETCTMNVLLRLDHFVRARWRELFESVQKRQIKMNYAERKLELIWSLKLCSIVSESELLSNPLGRITQSICLPMLMAVLGPQELHELNMLMDLLRLDLPRRMSSFANCGQLHRHIATLGTYYIHAFEELQGATRELRALHLALDDVVRLFEVSEKPNWSLADAGWLLAKRERYLEGLARELLEQFEVDFLDRICQELEVELRLQIHRHLYTDDQVGPYRRHTYNFKDILEDEYGLPVVLTILTHRINLKRRVERHLNEVCYNLTAIAPHEWLTYDNMMSLARHKYGLRFIETQLPAQTLDSGLDLLEIIRNLALFASRYSYDLTQHSFLEKCSNRLSSGSTIASVTSSYAPVSSNQSLNVLQIEHVAQSIRTHGFGILDSAVNCTYQTLKRLVNVFSRQLMDDKLRAVLQREYQQMVNNFKAKRATHWTISFDKANRMARKFKLSASNLTDSISLANSGGQQSQQRPGIDLDSIRQTVTQLGNILAFIRLIKSGALNSASRAVDYVPELEDLASLRLSKCAEEEFQDYQMFPSLLSATKNFDQCLDELEENFLPKTSYSKIIVNLFTNLLSPNSASQPPAAGHQSEDAEGQARDQDERDKSGEAAAQATSSKRPATGHMNLFFLLVPALTINYIDYLTNCKERVASRSSVARFGALLSDDGFPMGVAFLLTVLGQISNFNKLDWLAQTCTKLSEDIVQVEVLLNDPKHEESLRQTSSMTLRRLRRLHAEYTGLQDTLTCSLMLFENLVH